MDLSISPREERMMEIREVYLKIKGKWIQLFSCPGYKCILGQGGFWGGNFS